MSLQDAELFGYHVKRAIHMLTVAYEVFGSTERIEDQRNEQYLSQDQCKEI